MYIIMKSTRSFDNPTRLDAYRGPACEDSGVEGGQVYTSRVEAEFDAERLTTANPVGFVVIPLVEG